MIQASLEPSEELEVVTSVEATSPWSYDHPNEYAAEMDLKRDVGERVIMLGLPQDLEDLVLARLPISVLYKIRPVCKRWYSLLTHLPFLNLRNEIQPQQEATFFPLVFWNDGKATLRISRTGSRLELIGIQDNTQDGIQDGIQHGIQDVIQDGIQDSSEPIHTLNPKPETSTAGEQTATQTAFQTASQTASQVVSQCATWSWLGYDSGRRRWQTMKPFITPIDVKSVVTGSNGLLCLRGESSLLVVNPMTGSQREVPLKENVVQLVVHNAPEQHSFKILCAASRKRAKIYDSRTGLWSKRGRPTPTLALSNHIGAYSDGVLYCVAREERSGKWGVVKYNVEGTRTWSDAMFFPLHRGETIVKAKVIEFMGEIFALIEKEIHEDDIGARTKSLSLWKLEREGLQWRLAGVMPTLLRQHLVNLDDFDCVALNNRLCVLNKSSFKAVACFVSPSSGWVASWEEFSLDSYFSADTPLVERCIVGFAFEPSLLVSI